MDASGKESTLVNHQSEIKPLTN